jgi:hypothetical protein
MAIALQSSGAMLGHPRAAKTLMREKEGEAKVKGDVGGRKIAIYRPVPNTLLKPPLDHASTSEDRA